MSLESRQEDGDGGEQTPGHAQPVFELLLQDQQLQMTFLWSEGEKKTIILLFLVGVVVAFVDRYTGSALASVFTNDKSLQHH